MLALVFANGDLCPSRAELPLQEAELVLAADGGSRHCQALDLIPDVLIGDLDSTPGKLVHTWEDRGVEIIRHPGDKDQTDLELALLLAQSRGADSILVYGAAGGRLDMTFGNLMLLAHPQLDSEVVLICGQERVQVLRPGDRVELQGAAGDTVSLISLLPGTSQITTRNLAYPLEEEALAFGVSRGISNQLSASPGTIELKRGLLAVIHTRNTALEDSNHAE